MKKSFLFLLAISYGLSVMASDIIITKNNERINATILEISETEVKYKKESNPNGPTFTASMNSIASIVYGNTIQSVNSDLIVTGMSDVIEAQIIEVTDSEVKYKKVSNLNGPIFSMNAAKISSILFANGDVQVFSASQPKNDRSYAAAPNKKANDSKASAASQGDGKLHFNPQPSDNYVFGITLGYVAKQIQIKSGGVSEKYGYGQMLLNEDGCKSTTPAMRFGFTYNPMFKYGVGIRTGLFMEYARETTNLEYKGYDIKGELNDIIVSIPLQVSYRYEIIKDLSVMLYTGPIFDFGALLQYKYSMDGETEKSENLYSYKYFLDEQEKGYSGFNCLWGIGAGVQWRFLRLDLGGDFGMVNKYANTEAKVLLNKPFYVTLTCFF